MKLLYVYCGSEYGCDYSALNFQNEYAGTKVSDIIMIEETNPGSHKPKDHVDEYECWDYSIQEVGEVSPEFIKFLRGIQDYDDSKHHNFWMENEVIPQ